MAELSPSSRALIEAAKCRVVDRDVNPLLGRLPSWVKEYRPHQVTAIEQVVDSSSRVNVVVLDAPTGSGKTSIGETVRLLLQTRGLYICSSKSLQDQVLRDYDYARVLKGRVNYPTRLFPNRFRSSQWDSISCEDCTWSMANPSCKWCGSKTACPYEGAKREALSADLAVLNTSYLLAEANNVGRFSRQLFILADEADLLESSPMSHVAVEISERRLSKLNWSPPQKVTVEDSWVEWMDEHVSLLSAIVDQYPEIIDDLRLAREAKYHVNLLQKLRLVQAGLRGEEKVWVYTGRGARDDPGAGVSFRPSRVDHLGGGMLWAHGDRWLLMSATVVSSAELLSSLGWQEDYETIAVPSTFPVRNRQVHYRPVAANSRANEEQAWPKIAKEVETILDEQPSSRVLVHTVSYKLTRYLSEHLRNGERAILSYSSAADREDVLAKYRATANSVLLAPSLDRGIDLVGDECRVQILVKIPYPYLGDRQIKARLYSRGGRLWYTVQTVRTIVQMCGRAVRSSEDWANTYILDSQFGGRLWSDGRRLFPPWFREAIVWRGGSNG